jgi:hypothetical protein
VMTTTKRPFRLGLKSRSADTAYIKSKKSSNGGAAYAHPLAGQQDLFRKPLTAQIESEPEAGPSRSRESLIDPDVDLKEQSVEDLSETSGWFRSLAADEESILSLPNPAEAGLGSLSENLKDVISQQETLQNDTSGFTVTRQPDQQRLSFLTPERKQAELLQMASNTKVSNVSSPIREGGILGRLKRISKKEKSRAAREASSGLEMDSIAAINAEEKETALLPSLSSSTEFKEEEIADPMLSLREGVLEMMPKLERPRRDRIQSVQPSLVDDESIYGRQSLSGSQADFDEEDLRDRLLLSGHRAPSILQSEQGLEGYMEEEEDDDEDERSSTLDVVPDLMPMDRSYEQSIDSPSMDIVPSTPAESVYSEATPLEYMDAASRQSSYYDSLRDRYTNARSDEQEEEAITPKAAIESSENDYFSVAPVISPQTSAAPSSASINTASTPTKAMPVKRYTWYRSADLNSRQRHYFLRHVISRELQWEYERLFLVSNRSSLFQPSAKNELPRSDIGYFKKEANGLTPDLPLMRFLYNHVLSTCPLFGPSQPIEGAAAIRARKEGARRFLDEAVLPLLRFQNEATLNHGVDIYGERPSEWFDTPSTTGVMMGSLFKALVKFVAAAVPDGKSRSLPWSDIATPSSEAYFRHRVAPSKLKQGGMEVNIVGARLPSSTKDCELLISVRRFGFPPHYVVRTESDFYDYAIRLAEEVGRRTRIRAVPPPAWQETMSTSSTEELTLSVDHNGNESPNKRPRPVDQQMYGRRNVSQSSLQSLNQQKPIRVDSNDSLSRLKDGNSSSASFGSQSSSTYPTIEMDRQGSQVASTPPTKTAATPEKSRFSYRSKADTSVDPNASRVSLSSSATHHQGYRSPPLSRDPEARRKQLRAWLRDALSVRGAGHAKETKAFLEVGAFSEKEVKSATKGDVQRRADLDAKLIQAREVNANNAPDEIIELQKEMKALRQDCIDGDGLLKALEAVKTHDTFISLPLSYQMVISWTNLQVAQFLHHVFLHSNEARANFDRATELLQCIPWTALSLALREPTGLMMQKVKSSLSSAYIIKKILALQLEDVPVKKVELEISSLRKRLGSVIMRKLEGYVISSEWQKRVIRKASKRNNIPLVAAIVRGDDKPLLAAEGIKRITTATRVFQEFNKTQPTYEERRAKISVNAEVRLITDMQRALRLLSLRRNGHKIREALGNQLRAPMEALLEPFFSLLKRLHRSRILARGSTDVIVNLRDFLYRLFDILAGLKLRIQDPWRSLSTLTLLLDDVIPSWYRLLHQFANNSHDSAFLQDITQWIQSIFTLLSAKKDEGSGIVKMEEKVAPFWQPPKGGLNQADRANISELIQLAKINKSRMMESACRWAAGDIDADCSIQLLGEGGKTRVTPIDLNQEFAPPPTTLSKQDALDVYLPGLRSALSRFM